MLSPPAVKINKTQFKTQTAESIENDCNSERPCYVWLAWKLRSSEVVLKAPPVPTLSTGLTLPEFTVVYAGAEDLSKVPIKLFAEIDLGENVESHRERGSVWKCG